MGCFSRLCLLFLIREDEEPAGGSIYSISTAFLEDRSSADGRICVISFEETRVPVPERRGKRAGGRRFLIKVDDTNFRLGFGLDSGRGWDRILDGQIVDSSSIYEIKVLVGGVLVGRVLVERVLVDRFLVAKDLFEKFLVERIHLVEIFLDEGIYMADR